MYTAPDISIVIAALNEEVTLPAVVEELNAGLQDIDGGVEIIIVDDGSTDGTNAVAVRLADTHEHVRLVVHERNQGLGRAVRTGLAASTGQWVTLIPADGQLGSETVKNLYEARQGAVAVIGTVPHAERTRSDGLVRLILSRALRKLIWTLHPNMPSVTATYMVLRAAVDADDVVCVTGLANLEIPDRARRQRPDLKINSAMVVCYPRQHGYSKVTNFRTIILHVLDILRLRLNYILHGARRSQDRRSSTA